MGNVVYRLFITGRGVTGRLEYFFWGLGLMALKFVLDFWIARAWFGESWHLWSYFRILAESWQTSQATRGSWMPLVLLAASIPFALAGVSLTMRRLRDAGWPLWFGAVFFVPGLNLLLFATLCSLPSQRLKPTEEVEINRPPDIVQRLMPESPWGCATLSSALAAGFGLTVVVTSTLGLGTYGSGLFVALPAAQGFLAALLYGARRHRTLKECVGVALASVAVTGFAMLAFAFEGLICLIMAAPIALILAVLGAIAAFFILLVARPSKTLVPAFFAAAGLPSAWIAQEAATVPRPEVFQITTSVDIDAAPLVVWEHVVRFSELPPPTELIFRFGIAYPMRAEIVGTGPGAIRTCHFSTGPFVEPIEIWEEPVLLRFSVTSNPAPMEEWTPYPHVHPPHLEGFMKSQAGQFRLVALPGGGTRLEGTTWYEHGLEPARYWRAWSDWIIHAIHLRVLKHIKQESETPLVKASADISSSTE
ncbi:MAG: DUF805 domain-containing protein [Verrucomicrobia bacterium]|nr:DUF805 domain-containing protein [Verrucomicrobiota bacterium]